MDPARENTAHDGSSLADLLAAYNSRARSGASAREEVEVSVKRIVGFQNRARTGSGHVVLIDEPDRFGGRGQAADPAELLLTAIGASLCVTFTAHAAMRGVLVEAVAVNLSAWMAADSFFRPWGGAPRGIQDATIELKLRSSASRAELRALLSDVVRASPVISSLKRRPQVKLLLEDAE